MSHFARIPAVPLYFLLWTMPIEATDLRGLQLEKLSVNIPKMQE
ncbi:hypothetical protein [Cuspidothrix issatschenkoi]|nr:hypothetical protein [Cuspidothrix issatschenkoi]